MGGREGGEHVVKGGGTGTEEESHNWRGTLKEGGGKEGREKFGLGLTTSASACCPAASQSRIQQTSSITTGQAA